MAGRGTDIKLGEGVKELGGLAVLGTERHESRRIDNQLRGRSGRQGDPGFSQFYVSFEDELMVRFGTDRAKGLLQSIGFNDEMAIRHKMLTSSMEQAQKRVEGTNYDIRKTLLEYDDVINKQREEIYNKRNQILDSESIHELVLDAMENFLYDLVYAHMGDANQIDDAAYDELLEYYNEHLVKNKINKEDIVNLNGKDEVVKFLFDRMIAEFDKKAEEVPEEVTREFEKAIFLRVIDTYWMEHINTMSILREGIHLRGYANENPLRAYTNEGFELFENLLMNIDKDVTMFIIKAEVRHNTERKQVAKPIDNVDTSKTGKKKPKTVKKVGRNEQCPCGSGKKYKQCCGK
jgi:preprotein translocase subunit SecA